MLSEHIEVFFCMFSGLRCFRRDPKFLPFPHLSCIIPCSREEGPVKVCPVHLASEYQFCLQLSFSWSIWELNRDPCVPGLAGPSRDHTTSEFTVFSSYWVLISNWRACIFFYPHPSFSGTVVFSNYYLKDYHCESQSVTLVLFRMPFRFSPICIGAFCETWCLPFLTQDNKI